MTNEEKFYLEGEFIGVCALKGYKLKYLRLKSQDQEFIIKIPKELRGGMVYKLSLGDRIFCEGVQKDLQLKAYAIEKVDKFIQTEPVREGYGNKSTAKILICQKSHCFNNGGKEVYEALANQISSHNLNDFVTLKSTGCLKCCKQAPNLVVLPDKLNYRNVRTSQIADIISNLEGYLSLQN